MSLTRRNVVVGSLAAPLLAQRRPAARRPNVVLILADDLAAWMLGCYGNREFRTPNIDRLARSGVRFANSFCATPICSASRATLFTGRMPRQHGIHDFLSDRPIDAPPQGQLAPPPSFAQEVMLSDVLAGQGYRCGYVGKWHLGGDRQPGHGHQYTYTMLGGSRTYTDPEMYLNGQLVKESGYLAELMTRRAGEFLDQQKPDQPFLLTIGYLNPHTPYSGHPQRYYDLYAAEDFDDVGWEPMAPNALREKELMKDPVGNLRRCAASVTALDDQVGAILERLQQRGLRDNTIVVFTGDNGFLLGRHGLWSKGLASDPINMYDEVVQVPMLWSWPGEIPVESVRPELVSFYDFLPTVCDAARAPVPAGRKLVGQSYLALAQGKPLPKGQTWPGTVFAHFRNTEMARDSRFKLVLRNDGQGPNELYELRTDAREKVNRYDDPRYLTVRDGLAQRLSAFRTRSS